jgi:serine phosphatase RsbU (regulator of sigma subunit)/type II secretory pathway pseudopilin PulG
MEELARRYARMILLAHLALLVVIIVGVALAARGVYNQAKEQAQQQFLEKQSLLAQQTANAIEAHYRSIVSSLDVLDRDQNSLLMPPRPDDSTAIDAAQFLARQLTGATGEDRIEALLFVGHTADARYSLGPGPSTRPTTQGAATSQPTRIMRGVPPPPDRGSRGIVPMSAAPDGGRGGGMGARGGAAAPDSGRGSGGIAPRTAAQDYGRGMRGIGPGARGGPGIKPPRLDELKLFGSFPTAISPGQGEKYLALINDELKTVERPEIGDLREFAKGLGHVIVYPSQLGQFGAWVWLPDGRVQEVRQYYFDHVWLVAVAPVQPIKTQFLEDLNRRKFGTVAGTEQNLVATLTDDRGVIIATSDATPADRRPTTGADQTPATLPSISAALVRSRALMEKGETGELSFTTGDNKLATLEPVVVCDKTWFLFITSPAANVDAMVAGIFRKASWWSVLVVLAMTALLVSSSTSMIRSRLRLEQMRNEVLSREMDQARKIQLAWLPQQGQHLAVEVAAVNQPANHISGDFYDWFELRDGRIVVTIGDVTGHGMSAAFLMATSQLLIRNTMLRLNDPGPCLTEVNRQLCGQVFSGQFVTACVILLDSAARSVAVASAGHFAPLLHDGKVAAALPSESQLVLGVDAREEYPTERFSLPERYTLVLFTDGVVEARSRSSEPFGQKRLREMLKPGVSAASALHEIVQAVAAFSGGTDQVDDLTLVAVRPRPPSAN